MLAGLLKVAATDPKLKGMISNVEERELHITGIDQARPWAIGALAHHAPVLVVTATGREAEDLTAELKAMMGDKVAWFPSWETLPHERLSPGVDIVGRRAQVLSKLDSAQIVVTAARAFCQPVLKEAEGRTPLVLIEGREFDFSTLSKELVFRAYKNVDMVAKRGEFATRGGILDIFPTTLDYPVRVEFWGDEVSDIRQFSVADQRTIPEMVLDQIEIYPARELLITDAVAKRAEELMVKHPGNPTLVEMLSRIADHTGVDGMEALIPALVDTPLVPLTDLMPVNTHVVVIAPEKVRTRIADLEATDAEFLAAGWEAAAMGADGPVATKGLDLEASSYRSYESLQVSASQSELPWWTFAPPGMFEASEAATLPLDFEPGPAPRGDLDGIKEMMSLLLAHTTAGGRAAFIAPTQGAIKRMVERFAEQGIPTHVAT
ncbi:MAG: transcription-repair coupling factor, partial [Corynebacterium sp.]|nr:transcription-repair coupling factor [Corynebacterium sp.]